jgi:hypothetical protein
VFSMTRDTQVSLTGRAGLTLQDIIRAIIIIREEVKLL